MFRISSHLWDKIHHFASFPQTGGTYRITICNRSIVWRRDSPVVCTVSLQQMAQFGQNPSQGTLLLASRFLAGENIKNSCLHTYDDVRSNDDIEELPVRLAHRVKELNELPHRLNEMPRIIRVKEWYAQSFEVSYERLP